MNVETLLELASDAGLTLRVSTTGGLEATPSSALTRELRSLLVEHKAVIVSALAAPADLTTRATLDQHVGLPGVRNAPLPSAVAPLTCPTMTQLHLTTEQAELAARWAWNLEELDPEDFQRYVDRQLVVRASTREVLWRNARRARANQRERTPGSNSGNRHGLTSEFGLEGESS